MRWDELTPGTIVGFDGYAWTVATVTPDLWDADDVAAHRTAVLNPATAQARPVIVTFTRRHGADTWTDSELTVRFGVAVIVADFWPVVFHEHHAVCTRCNRLLALNTGGCTSFECAACPTPWPCPTHLIDVQVDEFALQLNQLPTTPEGDTRP